MNSPEVIEGTLDGLLQNSSTRIRISRFGYSSKEDGPFSRRDLARTCICGSLQSRSRMGMELLLREAEAGECHAILDLSGVYAPLIDYIPSLKVYKIGRFASLNPFKLLCTSPGSGLSGEETARAVSEVVQTIYELSRDERIYLERGLVDAYADGLTGPTMDDVNDRLLQVQAEVQPKEAYKIECLKNVLWEMDRGALGSLFRSPESCLSTPAVFDLSAVGSARGKTLVASCLLLRAGTWGATSIVLEPADRILMHGTDTGLLGILDLLEKLSGNGTLVHLCTTSPSLLPKGIADGTSTFIFCGPLWERDLVSVERSFALGSEESKGLRHLSEGSALLCVSGKDAPSFLRPSLSTFRKVTDEEIVEHMQALGVEQKELEARRKKGVMLEKVFKDRAALVYAWEVLRLVRGGKVPVDAVTNQKNVLLRAVVKALKRYFMIVEYTDSTGMAWYRLTKVGENALSEMGGEERQEGGGGGVDGSIDGAGGRDGRDGVDGDSMATTLEGDEK